MLTKPTEPKIEIKAVAEETLYLRDVSSYWFVVCHAGFHVSSGVQANF